MSVNVSFDLCDPESRSIAYAMIEFIRCARPSKDSYPVVPIPAEPIPVASAEPVSIPAAPAEPVSVADLKRAVVAAHKKVGQLALDLLAEYGTKCDQIPDEKRVELAARLAAL